MKKLLLATTLCAAFGAAQAVPTLEWDEKPGVWHASSGASSDFSGNYLNAAISGDHFDSGLNNYFGYIGGSIRLTEAPASLTFTYLGKEAGHTNTFRYGGSGSGNTFNNTTSSAFTSLFSVDVDNENRLNLTFKDLNTGLVAKSGFGRPRDSDEDKNPNNSHFGFIDLSEFDDVYDSFGGAYDYLVLFNDDWNDSDYNDMAVGVKVAAPIPEPETYALMLAGLGVVGFMARRRRQV